MNLILIALLAALCVSMFFVNRRTKLALLFVNYICFTAVTLPGVPFGNSAFIVPICFFISEIKYIGRSFRSLSRVVKSLIIIMIIASLVALANSPHYNDSVFNAIRFAIQDLVSKYLLIAYAFVAIKDEKDFSIVVNSVFYAIIVLTAFGLLNFATQRSIVIDSLGIETIMSTGRFRVQSLFVNPFSYGYACIACMFLFLYAYSKKMLSSKKSIIAIICCVFGIITCGSRSVLICAFASYLFYILLSKKRSKKFTYLISISLLLLCSYNFIPSVQEKIDQTLTVFTDKAGSKVSGSSLDMRQEQYLAALYYIQDDVWFGRGVGFFNIDLGWQDVVKKHDTSRTELAGLEGVVMAHLLERGVVGLIFYVVFYIILFAAFCKRYKYDKQIGCIGISLLVAYMLFSNANGELGSYALTLIICGALLHILDIRKILCANSEIRLRIRTAK